MKKLQKKLKQFSPDMLQDLIVEVQKMEHPLKKASISKAYSAWLRNDKENREFQIVFDEKLKKHNLKIEKAKKNFMPEKVGSLKFDTVALNYTVDLNYSDPWVVSYFDPTVEKVFNSIERFCETNGLELREVNNVENCIIYDLYTVLKL